MMNKFAEIMKRYSNYQNKPNIPIMIGALVCIVAILVWLIITGGDDIKTKTTFHLGIFLWYLFLSLMMGGYIGVLYYRLPRGENIFTPSHCPSCGNKLKIWELFPILGWFLVKGKCRNCHTKIDFQYIKLEFQCVYFTFFFTILFLSMHLILNEPVGKGHLLFDSLVLLLSIQVTVLYLITEIIIRCCQPIRIYRLLIKLLYFFIGVFFYLIIFITVPIGIGHIMRTAGVNISQHIVLLIILTSAINTIIWVFYFGLLLRHLFCRNQCGNGN
ncbi:MAG: prepilin peptidase [Planctomycetaceae bacterium]|jgi:prepilin signal peptidase PulO-like enzyme (type II secretory pathway)|nr:prepilin peptidase [Planctomycetaceae bacterium]